MILAFIFYKKSSIKQRVKKKKLEFAVKFSTVTSYSTSMPPEKCQADSFHCLTSNYLKNNL